MKTFITALAKRTGVTSFACVLGLAAATATVQAQSTIGLYELARFDLSATSGTGNASYIGSNPIAVGWNGSKLYVAGFNGSGTTSTTSIVEITNASSVTTGSASGFVAPTFSSVFGSISTPTTRGYTGLAMNGSQLAASLDLGTNSPNGIQMFNASTNTQSWNLSATGTNTGNIGTTRGFAGPDFDPGYLGVSGSGSGLGWTTQGAGRRLLNDSTNGAPIYVSATNAAFMASWPSAELGMLISPDPTPLGATTTWRDMAFDPATGDLYLRNQFGVLVTDRTGSNTDINPLNSTVGQSGYIYVNSGTLVSNNVGVTIGYMNTIASSTFNAFTNGYDGDLLVFNDRGSTANGQSWTNVIKFTSTSGSAVTPTWTFLSPPATGNGAYDYEWNSATQTLAVVDYANRNVSIFSTAVPEPSTLTVAGLGAASLVAMMLRRRREREED